MRNRLGEDEAVDTTTAGKGRVEVGEAQEPFVLALDIGSTGSRGDVYDAAGRAVKGGRHKVPHAFDTGGDGTSTLDPDAVVREVEEILDALARPELQGRIGGVALDTFASSLVGVAGDGQACTPCFTYADSRCGAQVVALRDELDEAALHQRTGTRLHSSYLAPRLRWLRETDPDTFRRAQRWMSLGEYVYLRLTGVTAAGTATAAWTGLLDRRTGAWDPELLAAAGVEVEQLSEVRDPSAPLREVSGSVASRWPSLAGAAWFPVVADGLSSNVGVGAVDASSLAASAATSGAMRVLASALPEELPSGLWCYRVDGSRSLLGGAVNDVGRALTWLESTVRLERGDLSGGGGRGGPVAGRPAGAALLLRRACDGVGGERPGYPDRHLAGDVRVVAGPGGAGGRRDLLRPDRRPAALGVGAAGHHHGQRAGRPGCPLVPAGAGGRAGCTRRAGDDQARDPARDGASGCGGAGPRRRAGGARHRGDAEPGSGPRGLLPPSARGVPGAVRGRRRAAAVSGPRRAGRTALGLAALLTTAGTLHLVAPHRFDAAVPTWLPGSMLGWELVSGVAELGCAALLTVPRTRSTGGYLTAGLFVAVFPGNLDMARRARSPRGRAITYARLPLQVPLVWWAWRVGQHAALR